MIFGTGIDIVEIDRIEKAVTKNSRFLGKFFTDSEIEYFTDKVNKYESIAGYFAAKEAVSKALGTGFHKLNFKDIEIMKNELNRPFILLHNCGKDLAEMNGIKEIHISISHSKQYAVANAIATL